MHDLSPYQLPYPDPAAATAVVDQLSALPALVAPGEIERLTAQLAAAARGEVFVIHGGDCVERFEDCRQSVIENKVKILLQMSLVLAFGLRRPVVRIARMAGQYFKPRSSATEIVVDATGREQRLYTYRGDGIHAFEPTAEARRPDPQRLVTAYFRSAATLNVLRSLAEGGFADLHHAHHWDLPDMKAGSRRGEYQALVQRILDAIQFMEAIGGVKPESLSRVELFTSHEALHLEYERALTRRVTATDQRWYAGSAHLLWIGERTRDPAGPHVAFCKTVVNPVAVKVGPGADPVALRRVVETLNPQRRPGRVTLITRFGALRAGDELRTLIGRLGESAQSVTWLCDPMHGNTVTTAAGIKTRRFDAILAELRATFAAHHDCGTHLGGVHFELTGDFVTECTGGSQQLDDDNLVERYESYCDPRLNYNQSMEMAFLLAELFRPGLLHSEPLQPAPGGVNPDDGRQP